MRDHDIYVGARLRIRNWSDMAAEFGTDYGGSDIDCRFGFTREMAGLCGKPFTVTEYKLRDNGRISYSSAEGTELINAPSWRRNGWNISSDMLEPLEDEEAVEGVPEGSLFDFLMGTKEET